MEEDVGAETVTARTESATASSAWVGSKKMFGPTEVMRRVIGGQGVGCERVFGF